MVMRHGVHYDTLPFDGRARRARGGGWASARVGGGGGGHAVDF